MKHGEPSVLKIIEAKNNEVEIGFLADGKACAYCLVDEVSLVKSK